VSGGLPAVTVTGMAVCVRRSLVEWSGGVAWCGVVWCGVVLRSWWCWQGCNRGAGANAEANCGVALKQSRKYVAGVLTHVSDEGNGLGGDKFEHSGHPFVVEWGHSLKKFVDHTAQRPPIDGRKHRSFRSTQSFRCCVRKTKVPTGTRPARYRVRGR